MSSQRGKPTNGVYLLLKGRGTVKISASIKIAPIGPGEVCGEISFLDEMPATADVIAEGAVEAYYLDRATLQSLFELFPHLASRFYRSIAANLSRRLREMIAPAAAASK
jgi:CRP-like cAMP-binding protein